MGKLTKQLIGKEDLSIQYNTNDPEQFSRLNSVGGTINLYQIPDIWTYTGAIRPGDIIVKGPWLDVRAYGAIGDGVTDDTAAIQAAHAAAVVAGYKCVVFPAGTYQFTTLTWSPHVGARAVGKVYLRTANASGRTIQISDQYGRPALYGINAPRNTIFDGQFYLINTNAANTAIAWTFGGLTNSYYCNIATALRGVETRGFHGGVYEFRYNAFLLDFYSCFDWGNNGPRIIVADPITNTGENINFHSCYFGTGASYLFDINTAYIPDFNFYGCSADYLLGLNKPGNSAPLTAVNWFGGCLEWDTVAAAYLQNDSASTWNIDGAVVAPTALAGWPTPLISQTTGVGTTNFINIKYVIPGLTPTLHDYVSATSKGVLDYSPNYQGGNTPSGLVTYHASAIIGYTGVTGRELTYTPTWSGTIGNGTLVGIYTRIGNRVDVSIKLIWGTTTSHGAAPQTLALPYQANATYPGVGSWWADDNGTGNRTGTAKVAPGGTSMTLYDDATAGQVTNAVPMTWAVNDQIHVLLTYFL